MSQTYKYFARITSFSLVYLLLVGLGIAPVAQADVAPPRGTKRIDVRYSLKAPADTTRRVYIWWDHCAMSYKWLRLRPVQWGKITSPYSGYRCGSTLLSLTSDQADALSKLLLKHPTLQKQAKQVLAMTPKRRMEWLRQLTFENVSKTSTRNIKGPAPVSEHIRKNKTIARLPVASQTLAAKYSPATHQVRWITIKGALKDTIAWKATKQEDRDKKNEFVPALVGKGAHILTRWPLILLSMGLAFLAAVFIMRKRMAKQPPSSDA